MARRTRLQTSTLAAALVLAGAAIAQDRLSIVNEGETASLWRPVAETRAMPAYPGIVTDKSEDVCVNVGYMLKEDGSTSDFAILKAWGSKTEKAKPTDPHFLPFSQNALAAVQRWRFESAAGATAKLRPVYTSATFAFSTTGADAEGLKARCRIDDLRDFIGKAQAEAARKNLNRGQLDRNRQQNPDTVSGPKGTTINP
jgi:hypothetical protein